MPEKTACVRAGVLAIHGGADDDRRLELDGVVGGAEATRNRW
ncbi:hypothetical protein [Nocardia sp. NBC_01329]|nr:hypothetical protein OG405_02965 [Nocardia sp. NBC_01329]